MANPLNLSLAEYPHLARLINGQDLTLRMKVRVGHKTLTGQGEYLSLSPDSIDFEEEKKPSVQEVMLASLASIDKSLGMQNISSP